MNSVQYDIKKAKAYHGFVTTMERWYQFLKDQNPELLTFKSEGIYWSISELYDHLMKVADSYQLYYFHRCVHAPEKRKFGKNLLGLLIFDFGYVPFFKLKFETFPKSIRGNFVPENKPKEQLMDDFLEFTDHVRNMKPLLEESLLLHKQYHPMFGWLNAAEWFSLIEIHFTHHERQKKLISTLIQPHLAK